MAFTRYSGLQVTENHFVDFFANPVPTYNTAGVITFTPADLLAGIILRDCAGAGRADNTPTAAAIVAALKTSNLPCKAGQGFYFTIRNTSGGAFTITLTAGAGVTISGTATIAQNNSKDFLLIVTDPRDGNAAVTIYSLGTATF